MENKCGERIKMRLSELNMTQADLCRKTGINSATMSQYISGKYYPAQDRIELLANALKTTPAYLVGWTDNPRPYTQEELDNYDPLKGAKLPYYLDPEVAQMAQELYERPEMRVLFDASRNASPEDIEQVAALLEKLSNK